MVAPIGTTAGRYPPALRAGLAATSASKTPHFHMPANLHQLQPNNGNGMGTPLSTLNQGSNCFNTRPATDQTTSYESDYELDNQATDFRYATPSADSAPIMNTQINSSEKSTLFNLHVILYLALWYAVSSLTTQLTKAILNDFEFPVFVGEFQFMFNFILGLLTIKLAGLYPSFKGWFPKYTFPKDNSFFVNKSMLKLFFPMGTFQFIGKLFSLAATSVCPVATVSSIRALSPLFIILGYRLYYKVKFSLRTYISLLPLLWGVIIIVFSQANIPRNSSNDVSMSHYNEQVEIDSNNNILKSATDNGLMNYGKNAASTKRKHNQDEESAKYAKHLEKIDRRDSDLYSAQERDQSPDEMNVNIVSDVQEEIVSALDDENARSLIASDLDVESSPSSSSSSQSVLTYLSDLLLNNNFQLQGVLFALISTCVFAAGSIYAKNVISNDSAHDKHEISKLSLFSSDSTANLATFDLEKNQLMMNQNENYLYNEKFNKKQFRTMKKADKLTTLMYCSLYGLAYSIPTFITYELPTLLSSKFYPSSLGSEIPAIEATPIPYYHLIPWTLLIINGLSYFIQSLLAFHILGMLPTVTYSIANMMKRIIVIAISMILRGTKLGTLEWVGLLHVTVGLYIYEKLGTKQKV